MRSTKIIFAGVIVVVLCTAAGYVGFRALYYETQYLKARDELVSIGRKLTTGNATSYGTLASVDTMARIVTVNLPDLYVGSSNTQATLLILDDTVLIKQTASKNGGVTTGIASSTPITMDELASMPAGTRLKFVFIPTPKGAAAMYVIAGDDPL